MRERDRIDLSGVDVLVDLQTGVMTLALPADLDGHRIELESAGADDTLAPKE